MKKLEKFKLSLIFFGTWVFCFAIFLATPPNGGYAATQESAKLLGGIMNVCVGGIINTGVLGYQCNAYAPNKLGMIVILIGIVSFITTLVTLVFSLASKDK